MTNAPTSRKTSVVIAFVIFLGILLSIFAYQLKNASQGFDRWVGHEDHRLPNILQVEPACRWPVLSRFMDLQPLAQADAFMLGDSQIYARGATQEELFYTHWLSPEATVINFSYFGGPVGDMYQIAEELERRGHKAKFSYTALNLTHFTRSIYAPKASDIPGPSDGILPKKPNAISALWQNRFVCAFRYRKSFTDDLLRTPRYRTLTGAFKKSPLPDGYVAFNPKNFERIVPFYFKDYPIIAERMVVASAPIAYDQFAAYEFSESHLRDYETVYDKFCDGLSAPFTCLDLLTEIDSVGFGDLIHLNAEGQARLGRMLKEAFPPY